MTDTTTIDVLCQRMIEDMTARKLGPASQKSRLRAYNVHKRGTEHSQHVLGSNSITSSARASRSPTKSASRS
jgi:hypothetical protein